MLVLDTGRAVSARGPFQHGYYRGTRVGGRVAVVFSLTPPTTDRFLRAVGKISSAISIVAQAFR